MKAWHFLPEDMSLGYEDKRIPKVGEWLSCEGELDMCKNGMHASEKIMDALSFQKGHMICRVELGGKIIKGNNKCVAEKRKILWMINGEKVLRQFAVACAKHACDKVNNNKELNDFLALIIDRYEKNGWKAIEKDEAYLTAYRAAYWAVDGASERAVYRAAERVAYWAANEAADEAAYWAAYLTADGAAERLWQEETLLSMVELERKALQ